ncbi:hypothetical protein ACEE24_02335 [Latilactobacillus curvatus]|uniref:Uncharacterized protein n=1 Tax=Latilactobacillus curvatus TaxID=28038 RepID=A0AAC9UPJ8_LATCU|nr:hypothetical protein [Latilactobacillus curvatus]ASN59512.1 hypothetical protein CG419_02275 [Latilactobacillus curvatus]
MKKFNNIMIVFILLLSTSFFSLMTTTQKLFLINSYIYKTLIIALVVVALIINWMFNRERLNRAKNLIFLPSSVMMMIALIIVIMGTQIIYQQSILTAVKNSYFYLMLAVYFWLIIFTDEDFLENMFRTIAWCGGIYSSLLIIQSFIYVKGGPVFLDYGQFGLNPLFGNLGVLFKLPRIAVAADFVSFAMIITLADMLLNREKKQLIINSVFLILDLFFIIFVSGTRMYIIIDLIMVAYTSCILLWQNYKGTVIVAGSTIVSGILTLLPKIMHSFTSGERSVSYDIRKEEIAYYFNNIFKHGIFGIGFPDTRQYEHIIHGFKGITLKHFGPQYFLEDVGILGIFAVFGVFGLIWIIILIIDLYRSWQQSQRPIISLLLIGYIVLTAVTLSLFDAQRILYLFLILYSLDYLTRYTNYQSLEEIKE